MKVAEQKSNYAIATLWSWWHSTAVGKLTILPLIFYKAKLTVAGMVKAQPATDMLLKQKPQAADISHRDADFDWWTHDCRAHSVVTNGVWHLTSHNARWSAYSSLLLDQSVPNMDRSPKVVLPSEIGDVTPAEKTLRMRNCRASKNKCTQRRD